MPIHNVAPSITPIVAQIITKSPNGDWNILDKRKLKTVPNNGHLIEVKTHENEEPIIYEVLAVLHLVTSPEGVDVKIYAKPKGLTSEVTKSLGK